eukprot:1743868-Pyramimonas_sp.AAC.1
MCIRDSGVGVPRMAFWQDSASSRRNNPVDPSVALQSREYRFGMLQGLQTFVFPRGSSHSGNEPL